MDISKFKVGWISIEILMKANSTQMDISKFKVGWISIEILMKANSTHGWIVQWH